MARDLTSDQAREIRPQTPNKGPSKKTQAWAQLGDFFTRAGAERAMKIMMESDDTDFMKHYSNLIELFKPKLARTELIDKGTKKIIIEIDRTSDKNPITYPSSESAEDNTGKQEV